VNRLLSFVLFTIFFPGQPYAQQMPDSLQMTPADTLPVADTVLSDSLRELQDSYTLSEKKDKADSLPVPDENPQSELFLKRTNQDEEGIFYLMVGFLLFFALLNRLFPKYLSDLYRLFFRTTINQSQLREQMLQAPLPSLLLNIFFILTGGFYLASVFRHFGFQLADNFWLMFLYSAIGLTVIYFIKYAVLKLSGWIFSAQDSASSYIFIVFLVNKIIGVLLLPVVILLSFTEGTIYQATLHLSWFIVGALLLYRYVLSFQTVRNQIKVSSFHFLLYFFAFEIAPLFIIYKSLLLILERTA
jgi:hypothetical protein